MSILPFPRRSQPEDSLAPPGPVDRSAAERDDAVIMHRLASGDTRALELLMDVYWAPLLGYASRLLDDVDAAQDAVQGTFLKLWSRRAEWKPGSLRAYLFRLTRNLVVDELRGRGARIRAIELSSRDSPAIPRTPMQLLQDEEVGVAVDRAIQALAPRRREVFTLAYLRGFSYREISELMEISTKTVENQMSAALADLRRSLASYVAQ